MRVDVFLPLFLFIATALGGGPGRKPKVLQGYDDNVTEYPNDTSNCSQYRGTRKCPHAHHGWHFNPVYGICFWNEYTYCGVDKNYFLTCEECNRECKVSGCAYPLEPPD
uniref:Putative der and-72 secreted protein n=1 Tax=Rhipicephalus pulchellus TaxID=72859 RepID=L7LVB3_RHIPC